MNKIPPMYSDNHSMTPCGCTAVLVTNQFECERLIRAGRAIANDAQTDLCVINVENNEYPTNPEAIQHLFNVSSENGAVMHLMYSENSFKTICEYLKTNRTAAVVTGMPSSGHSILHRIWKKFPSVQFFTVNRENKVEEVLDRKSHMEAPIPAGLRS